MTTINEVLMSLVEEITLQVLTEEAPAIVGSTDTDNPLLGALKQTRTRIRNKPGQTPAQIMSQEKQVDVLIAKLLAKRKGKATLNRGDIEMLDKLTRWMRVLPFGKAYRRGLAKYLRSKDSQARKEDPFRDFRRYSYDDNHVPFGEGDMKEDIEQQPVKYYHGTNQEFKQGALILAPSKTGKVSEKGRKKNLDVVFFTKDPKSALIYAGRAVQSFGNGAHNVYQVEPQGPISVLNDDPGTTVYTAPYAKVIGKVKFEKKNKVTV